MGDAGDDREVSQVTVTSNRSTDHHKSYRANEMPVNTNMTTEEGIQGYGEGHCMTNEDCLGDTDYQDRGKLELKLAKL